MFKIFAGLFDPFEAQSPFAPDAKPLAFIVQQLRPLRWMLLLCLITAIAASMIEVWLIYYAGWLVDALATVPREALWDTLGTEFLIAICVLLVLRPVIAYLYEALADIAFRPASVSLIRWRAHRHVMHQPVGWFRNEQSGQLATRVREIGVSATNAVYACVHTLAYVLTYFICSLWLLASIDLRLTLPLLLWAVLYLLHMAYAVPRFRNNYEAFEGAKTQLTSQLVDTYSNIETVKLYAQTSQPDAGLLDRFRSAYSSFMDVQRFEVLINVGMVFLSNLLMVVLVGYAIYLWYQGAAMLGLIAAALTLSLRISGMADWALDAVAAIYGSLGATREALKSVAQPLAITDPPGAPALKLTGGAIQFDTISHHFGQASGGLNGLSLDIAAGEKIGLVGPSGAGKSTLVSLLMGHYRPESGRILIDGQDIAHVQGDSLRTVMSSVAQDASLLNRSIRDNIAFGTSDATPDQIKSAASQARADAFIVPLADPFGNTGYDTLVGERGVRLSGGQKQRISLARALLRDAPVLILDEATSALDSDVETDLQVTLQKAMAGKTVIAIAHRLSTLTHMDRIAVLNDGKITELGCHADLLKADGLYARLWNMQTDGRLGQV